MNKALLYGFLVTFVVIAAQTIYVFKNTPSYVYGDLPVGAIALPDGNAQVAAVSTVTPTHISISEYPNPLAGKVLYWQDDTSPERQATAWAKTRPAEAEEMRVLASQSRAVWLGSWNADIQATTRELVDRSTAAGQVAVLVAYNVPSFSCERYTQDHTGVENEYLQWIRGLAAGIGNREAVIILEPDALAGRDCLNKVAGEANLLNQAVSILSANSGTIIYIDAGHAHWNSVDDMARKLINAGISNADGFSLNVSNFVDNPTLIKYGNALSAKVGGKHFVIDTSRNGNGPTTNFEWCNPRGRAVGTFPTVSTGERLVDAFLWIKQPGESDGTCGGGPEAGTWWPEYALELMQNRHQ